MYHCEKCNKDFEKRKAYIGHCSSHNRVESYKKGREKTGSRRKKLENKLLTYSICKYCSNHFDKNKIGAHTINCNLNPSRLNIIEKIRNKSIGRKLSSEIKKKVSESMIKAHKEGRAWNIGKSRWNNEKSYPEKFFSIVINNEFINKNYITEYPIGVYSLDFAWPDLKKGIEIDGEQHERYEDYKQRDLKKDEFCNKNGWSILRIKWIDLYNNTKEKINDAKNFIDK
jgi:very-short-patch-repair endonuclease/uncharacterized C2H2 Zn-finger protein